jgi:hypothetical protein
MTALIVTIVQVSRAAKRRMPLRRESSTWNGHTKRASLTSSIGSRTASICGAMRVRIGGHLSQFTSNNCNSSARRFLGVLAQVQPVSRDSQTRMAAWYKQDVG